MGQYSQIGANDWLPTKEYSNVWDFIQNVSITKGTHAFKFGAEVKPIGFPFFQVPYPHGEMNFSRTETAFPSRRGYRRHERYALADYWRRLRFVLARRDRLAGKSRPPTSSRRRESLTTSTAQDDWKITPKLTVNYGLRYELWSPIGEQFARQSNFDFNTLTLEIPSGPNQDAALPPNFNTPYTFGGVTYPAAFPEHQSMPGLCLQYLIPWDKHDFGPRLGFAYNFAPKTVIRARLRHFLWGRGTARR